MADTNEMDFLSSFEAAFEGVEQKQSSNRNFNKIIDLCRASTMGTLIGRAIVDGNNRPLRMITGYRDFSYPDGEEGYRNHIHWMDSNNYVNITPDQRILNDRLNELINKVDEMRDGEDQELAEAVGEYWSTYRSRLFMMYMKVRKIIPKSGEVVKFSDPQMSLILHRSVGFGTALKNSINTKSNVFDSKSWIEKYFSRDIPESKFIMSIDTSRPSTGYVIQVNLDESMDAVKITEEDKESSKDLNQELISTTFNEEKVKGQIAVMEEILNDLVGGGLDKATKVDNTKLSESGADIF